MASAIRACAWARTDNANKAATKTGSNNDGKWRFSMTDIVPRFVAWPRQVAGGRETSKA